MRSFFCLVKVEFSSSYNDIYLVIYVVFYNIQKPHELGFSVGYRNHVYAVSTLQLSIFEKEIEDLLGIIVLLYPDYRSHTRSVRFVRDIGDSRKRVFVFFLQIGDFFQELSFIYLIRKFGYDDVFLLAFTFLDIDFSS